MKRAFLSFIAIFSIVFSAHTQTDDGRANDSKIIEVKKGIYLYQNKGGNIGLSIGNDGVFMIDDQFAEVSEDLLKDINRLTKKPLRFLVNTHHHGDHTGGNINMANEGALIFAHENVRTRLKDYMEKNAAMKIDDKILPVVTIKEDITFHFNGEEIMVFHVHNAHTDGDVMVYFTNSNVLHSGDAFVEGRYPFIDYASGGTYQGYIEGLERLLMMIDDDTKIIPGHGDVATVADVREMGNMLNFVYKRVMFHHMNKKTEAQILAMTDITNKWDKMGWGDGFISRERFLKAVYTEVSKKYDLSDYEEREKQFNDMKKKQDAKSGGI